MGYKFREIESKLLVPGTFDSICGELNGLLEADAPIIRVGSSVDTYWSVGGGGVAGGSNVPGPSGQASLAQFLRVRERDGIRQITVKGKDKGDNLNRIEVDIDSTSATHSIHRLVRCILGRPAGTVCKTYRVWELESEYDTVCAYEVTSPKFDTVIVEVEARTEERMLSLETQVISHFGKKFGVEVTRAPGSLFEMFIQKGKK